MASSEPGPELDRRVAEAMGKGPVFVYDCYPCHEVFAAYSTDPARIAEMVEWLRGHNKRAAITLQAFEGQFSAEWGTLSSETRVDYAETIQHALALLVVAVADSSKHA